MNEESKPLKQNGYSVEGKPSMPLKKSVNMFALINGLYLGVLLIAFSLVLYVADIPKTSVLNFLIYIPVIVMLVIALLNYRNNESGGFISYGKSLGLGTLTGLYGSLLFAVFTYLFLQFFDSSEIQKTLDVIEAKMLDMDLSSTDINKALKFYEMIFNPEVMALGKIIDITFWSFLFTLIIAIFVKRENPDLIFNE